MDGTGLEWMGMDGMIVDIFCYGMAYGDHSPIPDV
jgi:hypothetical protein